MAETIQYTSKIDKNSLEYEIHKGKVIADKANREIRQHKRYFDFLQAHLGEEYNFYEIWVEGYLCTGMEGIPEKARFLGVWPGKDFYDACCTYSLVMTEPDAKEPYVSLHPKTRTASIWGCSMFDNEEDARKSFG